MDLASASIDFFEPPTRSSFSRSLGSSQGENLGETAESAIVPRSSGDLDVRALSETWRGLPGLLTGRVGRGEVGFELKLPRRWPRK